MSIAAPSELLNADEGFPDLASLGMAEAPPDAMAEDGDGLVPVEYDGDAEATAEPELPDEPSVDPEVHERISSEVRAAVEAELRARYDQDFSNLRSTKDRETKAATDALLAKMAREPVLIGQFKAILSELGVDPADPQMAQRLQLMQFQVDEAERTAQKTQQAQVVTIRQLDDYAVERFQHYQAEAQQAGKPTIDPNDPVFLPMWHEYINLQRSLGPSALRALNNEQRGIPIAPQDAAAYRQLYQAGQQFYSKQEQYRDSLAQKAQAQHDSRVAAGQKAARTRQNNRGAQHTANSGGAAPISDAQLIKMAREKFPNDEVARFNFVRTGGRAQPQRS